MANPADTPGNIARRSADLYAEVWGHWRKAKPAKPARETAERADSHTTHTTGA